MVSTRGNSTIDIPAYVLVVLALGCLALTVACAAMGSWFMNRRNKSVTLIGYEDSSDSDHEVELDGSSASDGEPFDEDVLLTDIDIGRELGSGAFGTVYTAIWQHGTTVACKKLGDAHAKNDDILVEASRLRRLNHPNIVRFYGVYKSAGETYIVMEYVRHGGLDVFLRDERNRCYLQPDTQIRICTDVAAGMAYLSSRKVIHGDLGARNLLVADDAHSPNIKIADFGLSLICDSVTHDTKEEYCRIPNLESRKFPIRYSAPEVIHEGRYSIKSDVWSFGIVMWEVYSFAELPYQGKTNAEAIEMVSAEERLHCPEGCPPDVYYLMLRCWRLSPSKRPSFEKIQQRLAELSSSDIVYNTVAAVQEESVGDVGSDFYNA